MAIIGPGTQEEKEEAIERARAGMRKERSQQISEKIRGLIKPLRVQPSKLKTPKFGEAALGVTGLLGLPGGKPISQRAYPGMTGKKGRKKQGRGRTEGSYKYSIPGVGPVPIQAYKRWKSQVKAQARLQRELRQARLAAQVPPDHVRGYGGGAEDAWLMAEDMSQPQEMMPQEMEQSMPMAPPRRKFGFGNLLGGFGQPQQFDEFGPPIQSQFREGPRPPMQAGMGRSSRLRIWGDPMREGSNILNAPNIFNNPGQT
ncbi:MAG: hypothetical protein ACP5D2_03845, partial [Candidatus Nanoarchaeia archaeon]